MKKTITIDFDDTLYTKSFPVIAAYRLEFFKELVNSGIFNVVLVTARKYADCEEVQNFLNSHNIKINEIYCDCHSKLEVCRFLETFAHFDDSERICKELSENGINCFYCGEFLSNQNKQVWKESLVISGEWHFYVNDDNTRGMEE
jgi:hydroxymethylpyrimidine pyrophosphatase-like HAD family hydrolase